MLTINYSSLFLILLCSLWVQDSVECGEEESFSAKLKKCSDSKRRDHRRDCYNSGSIVTFLPGGYYCCKPELSDDDLISIGASAFWRKDFGFCGRGSCDTCSGKQECVVFSSDDVFCCPKGYQDYHKRKTDITSGEDVDHIKEDGHGNKESDQTDEGEEDDDDLDDPKPEIIKVFKHKL